MKNVYGYTRVSTTRQGEGASLEAQQESIQRFADSRNMKIVEWFEEKETAAKEGRRLFTNMVKLLKNKRADGVIIHKIDRSTRNLRDWVDITDLLDNGCEVHFTHENFDLNTRSGRLMADILVAVGVDMIRNQKQETLKGLCARLKQGYYPFKAPVGYIDQGKAEYKTFDPIKAPLVKRLFELYATKKHTLDSLSEQMNKLGLTNSKHGRISINNVSSIINNPFYMGIIRVKGVQYNGGHEPLITPALYKSVQDILTGNTNQKLIKHELIFRKLARCKNCGYRLIAETRKGIVYYRCQTKKCTTTAIREDAFENFLLKSFQAVELNTKEFETMQELLSETEKVWLDSYKELMRSIELQKHQINVKLERLTDCYVEGGLEKETYENRKGVLLSEIKQNEATHKKLSGDKSYILRKVEKFLGLSKSLIKSYEVANMEEKRELVETVTSDVALDGKKLVITMGSPYSELSQRYFLSKGAPVRAGDRNPPAQFVFSSIHTSPIIGEPLSREQLKSLLELIIETVSQLPDDNLITGYALQTNNASPEHGDRQIPAKANRGGIESATRSNSSNARLGK